MTWTKDELKAYVFFYCANADFVEKEEETDIIRGVVGEDRYKALRKEFGNANDYQRVQNIIKGLEHHGYTSEQLEVLFEEMRTLFHADGAYVVLEQNMHRALKRLLA
ncbi:MAG: hypothetical protein ACPGU4_11085 [Flavobacteriales bacterium]